jgi:peptide-methionine (S)-S-oxide reductase
MRRGIIGIWVAAITGLVAACGAIVTADTPDRSLAPIIETRTAVFAGGCFWCVEADFDKVPGVLATVSGYTGGSLENPTYKQVTRDDTGHYEAVRVTYDPSRVNYETLVETFWRKIDPTDPHGQFCDKGASYRSAIFVANAEERATAEASRKAIDISRILPVSVVTPILDEATFWPAEAYHQDYYKKNPIQYGYYRNGCGRDQRLKQLWGSAAKG